MERLLDQKHRQFIVLLLTQVTKGEVPFILFLLYEKETMLTSMREND